MKCIASAVHLIYLPKTLNWNKITFPALNSLNLVELVINELIKSISKKNLPLFLFLSDLPLLNIKISRAYITKDLDKFTKILITIDLIDHALPVFEV